MTAKCVPSTRFRVVLLSVVAVVTCIQSVATVSSTQEGTTQQHEDTPTSSASRVESLNEEKGDFTFLADAYAPSRFRETTEPPWLLEKLKRVFEMGTLENLKRGWQGGTTAAASFAMKAFTTLNLRLTTDQAEVVSGLFQHYRVQEVVANLFESPQYQQWSRAILSAFPDTPRTAHNLILSQLIAHYDLKLLKLLTEAKQVKDTQKIADQYESMLIDFWISESIETKRGVLQNPFLLEWFTQMPSIYKRSAVIELRLRLEENKVDLRSIAAAERGIDRNILTELQALKPYEVEFGRLGLHRAIDTKELLTSPNYEAWKVFVVVEAQMDFGEVLLSTLRKRSLSDRQLLDDLIAQDDSVDLDWIALKKTLVEKLTDHTVDFEAVLKQLGLDKSHPSRRATRLKRPLRFFKSVVQRFAN